MTRSRWLVVLGRSPASGAGGWGGVGGVLAVWGALLMLTLCGCARRPAFFPIGVYGVPREDLPAARAAGFNTVYSAASQEYLDCAHSAGLKVLAYPGTVAGQNFDHAKARSMVARLDSHPALWSWYLIDEPDLHNVPPAEVLTAHRHFKRVGARKPTALVLSGGGSAPHYGGIPDWMMVDHYPVPWAPSWTFWKHVNLARLGTPARTPLVAVLQAFSWEHYSELLGPHPGPFRPPSRLEMENMAHQALVAGVDGVFFYAWKARDWDVARPPGFHEALTSVVGLIRERQPLFQAEREWSPFFARFEPRDWERDHAVGTPVKSVWLRVRHGTERIPAGHYWVGVNVMETPITMEFKLPVFVLEDELKSLDGEAHPVANQWLKVGFKPLQSIVFGPFPSI